MYRLSIYAIGALMLAGCQSYRPAPVDLAQDAAHRAQTRRASISQAQARKIGLLANPALNKARLKLASSRAVRQESGWWQDPEFSWGIEQVLQEGMLNHEGGLGFTLPVTGLPGLEKQIAAHYAEADYHTLCGEERSLVAKVDCAWRQLAYIRYRIRLICTRLAGLETEQENLAQLVDAGESELATRLLATQRLHEAQREYQTALETEQEQLATLCDLLGMHPAAGICLQVNAPASLQVPAAVPVPDTAALLKAPKIQAQLAQYAVSETQLKAELRKQYPELTLGPGFTRDEGANEVGGEVGFTLPLWNRNRKAIAEARGNRDLSRLETLQTWRAELAQAHRLGQQQQLLMSHCRQEQQRITRFSQSAHTMERLHQAGELALAELAETRQQLYESRLALLDKLEQLIAVQAELQAMHSIQL